jgi:hypothetical protein
MRGKMRETEKGLLMGVDILAKKNGRVALHLIPSLCTT